MTGYSIERIETYRVAGVVLHCYLIKSPELGWRWVGDSP
jgi:hypothetical protein